MRKEKSKLNLMDNQKFKMTSKMKSFIYILSYEITNS